MLRGGFKAIHGDLLHIRFREKIVIFRRMRKRKKGKVKRDGRFFHLKRETGVRILLPVGAGFACPNAHTYPR